MSFAEYRLKRAETREAVADWERACIKMKLARVKERLAEVDSQHEPFNSIINSTTMNEREKLYAAAFYVVRGRMPNHPSKTP